MWRRALSALVLLLCGCGNAVQLEVVLDDCLADDAKYPGVCGCSIAEQRCLSLKDALVHRYAFEGNGRVVVDAVGGADGTVVNAELSGKGDLVLSREGEAEQYVELPKGIISSLSSATIEAWLVWTTPPPAEAEPFWERIFDFGVSTAGPDLRANGESYLFLAPGEPYRTPEPTIPRTAFRNLTSNGEVLVDSNAPFPIETLFEVAVVVDAQAQLLLLYLNGGETGRITLTEPLSSINDVNNWLGRSQFAVDSRFGGTFVEFRIYAEALSAAQLLDSVRFGPSPPFLQPGKLVLQGVSSAP